MLVLRGFKSFTKFKKLTCPSYINSRFLNTEQAVVLENNELVKRRRIKPPSTKELKVLKDNFLRGLFTGVVDKGIFEYPEVLKESDVDVVLSHSEEVEGFLRDASNAKLSEDVIGKLRELELFGLTLPQKYGGAGYNQTECTFLQECTGKNPTIGRFLGYQENFACKLLNLYGTEEQKEKYLPRLAQGKSFLSLAYLEKGPLIDLSKIEGQGIRDDSNNRCILNAEKKWVHDADKADLFVVLVKLPTLNDSDGEVTVNYNFFIVERDAPGVTVHKLKSEYAQENNLYDVTFNNVALPYKNILGGPHLNGLDILKSVLSYCNVTDAALCCNMLKQIFHEVLQFIYEKRLNVNDQSIIGHSLVQENLASLVIYVYALESAIYMTSGRYDTYDNPDLFYESIFVKSVAVEFLQIAIKKYIEVLGREGFKSSGILEEAMKTVQYYSVFEDNIEHLKMMGASEGVILGAQKLSKKVKIFRNPLDNDWEAYKRLFSSEKKEMKKIRQKMDFKLELQGLLRFAADEMEEGYSEFLYTIEEMFCGEGSLIMKNEHVIVRFGDMAAYLYACMACLSRASSSLCYDLENCKDESQIAQAFAHITNSKIKALRSEEVQHKNLTMYYIDIGQETFSRKGYPVEHPLSRTF